MLERNNPGFRIGDVEDLIMTHNECLKSKRTDCVVEYLEVELFELLSVFWLYLLSLS